MSKIERDFIDRELTAVGGEGDWGGWVEKVTGLSKEKKNLIETDNSMVITRRKGQGGWR